MNMKKALGSILTLALVSSLAVYASSSYFSDKETSSGNTFQAGSLDLKVNSTDNPGVLVNVPDLKPGDNYEFEKKLKVVDNPAFVWVMLSDLVATQGAQLEPEIEEENGIPKSDLHNYLRYDLISPTGTIIHLDDQASIASASGCWIPLGILPGNQEVTLTQSFHLPDSVTNWAQGDLLTFTENFYAVQERNNSNAQPPSAPYVWDVQAKQCKLKSISFYDDFNDSNTNSWLSAIPSQNYGLGNWYVDNQVLTREMGGDHLKFLVDNMPVSSQTIESKVYFFGPAGYGGLTVWYKDYDNWVDVFLYPSSGTNGGLWVNEKVNGIDQGYLYQHENHENTWYALKVIANGVNGKLDIYTDNVFVLTHQTNVNYRTGLSGLNSGNSSGYFDNFSLTQN